MPNWIRNKITFIGEDISDKIEKYVKNEEYGKFFDFNELLKIPDELNIERGSREFDGEKLYITSICPLVDYFGTENPKVTLEDFKKILKKINKDWIGSLKDLLLSRKELNYLRKKYNIHFNEVLELGKKSINNILNYGYRDWYEWSVNNWGTKWNSCKYSRIENSIFFDTPWNPPYRIFDLLSKEFNSYILWIEYSEESFGTYSGIIKYNKGYKKKDLVYKSNSLNAIRLYNELWKMEN